MSDWTLSGNLFEEKSRSKKTGYWAHKFRFRGKTMQIRLDTNESKSKQILVQKVQEKIQGILAEEGAKADWHSNTPKQHIDDYCEHLEAIDASPRYISQMRSRLCTMLDGMGITSLDQMTESKVEKLLASYRKPNEDGKAKHSQGSSVHWRMSIKAFTSWLEDEERIDKDMLRRMRAKPKGDVQITFRRRAIDEADFRRFISTTRESDLVKFGFTGDERATLYILTNQTGLRASEIASLTVQSFDFEEQTISIDCTISKRRRYDVIPMSDGLTSMMREFVADKSVALPLFSGCWVRHAPDMLKADLAASSIDYENKDGRLDFHALGRHSFCTAVGMMAGVSAVLAQRVCRFSTPTLLDRYCHVNDEQKRSVVANLPQIT